MTETITADQLPTHFLMNRQGKPWTVPYFEDRSKSCVLLFRNELVANDYKLLSKPCCDQHEPINLGKMAQEQLRKLWESGVTYCVVIESMASPDAHAMCCELSQLFSPPTPIPDGSHRHSSLPM